MTTGPDDGDACSKVQRVVDQLTAVQQEAENRTPPKPDGVASFNYLYTQITTSILARLQDGGFRDPQFLSELDVQFAKRYLGALSEYEQNPASGPRCWRELFDRRSNPRITRMQFAVAGVNAHVNFDLPFALVSTWKLTGPPDSAGAQHDDYEAVNQIFRDEMAKLRHYFEDPLLRELDSSTVKRVSDQFDDMLVVIFRNIAWHTGEHLSRLGPGEELKLKTAAIDYMAALAGQAVLAPVDIAERP